MDVTMYWNDEVFSFYESIHLLPLHPSVWIENVKCVVCEEVNCTSDKHMVANLINEEPS